MELMLFAERDRIFTEDEKLRKESVLKLVYESVERVGILESLKNWLSTNKAQYYVAVVKHDEYPCIEQDGFIFGRVDFDDVVILRADGSWIFGHPMIEGLGHLSFFCWHHADQEDVEKFFTQAPPTPDHKDMN